MSDGERARMRARPETIAAIRFGYGFRPGEAVDPAPDARMRALDAAAGAAPGFGHGAMRERFALVSRLRAARRALRDGGDRAQVQAAKQAIRARFNADQHERLAHVANSPNGFGERWAAFWSDHFTVAARSEMLRATVGRFERDAIRPHMTGRFADMLRAVVSHPVMLVYLDQAQSFGPTSPAARRSGRGLNENLARELLELHALGAQGGYGQEDVRQLAELLTGFTIDDEGGFTFRRQRVEPGAETVLGRSYGGGPLKDASPEDAFAFLDDLSLRPETARHIARKLAVHFAADAPDPALVEHLAARWRETGGDLRAVAEALVEHPAPGESFGEKAKRPFELVVSAIRAADVPEAALNSPEGKPNPMGVGALAAMAQPLWSAPGPDGWAEAEEAWITPQGLGARLRWASSFARKLAAGGAEPRAFARTALADAAEAEMLFLVEAAPEKWEGLALVLASPAFNRR